MQRLESPVMCGHWSSRKAYTRDVTFVSAARAVKRVDPGSQDLSYHVHRMVTAHISLGVWSQRPHPASNAGLSRQKTWSVLSSAGGTHPILCGHARTWPRIHCHHVSRTMNSVCISRNRNELSVVSRPATDESKRRRVMISSTLGMINGNPPSTEKHGPSWVTDVTSFGFTPDSHILIDRHAVCQVALIKMPRYPR